MGRVATQSTQTGTNTKTKIANEIVAQFPHFVARFRGHDPPRGLPATSPQFLLETHMTLANLILFPNVQRI